MSEGVRTLHPVMSEKIKAIVQTRYGSVDDLKLGEIIKPVPGADEVLVRVHAASVHPDIWHAITGLPYVMRIMGSGLFKPKEPVPGIDMAGHVESVGKDVTRFQPGDEVFGEVVHGNQWKNGGAYAELVAVSEAKLALKPPNISFEEAAAAGTAGLIAVNNLRGRVQPGQKVVVNGAGGGVGMIAVQISKAHGAEVTGIDNTEKLDLLRSLGADHVVDYTRQDFTQNGPQYDLMIDVVGSHPFSDYRRVLTPDATYVLIGHDGFGKSAGRWVGSIRRFLKLLVLSPFVSQNIATSYAEPDEDPLNTVRVLLETGGITPIVSHTYLLAEVPEAIRHMVEGNPVGRIVISLISTD